jgi:hypothetical protein
MNWELKAQRGQFLRRNGLMYVVLTPLFLLQGPSDHGAYVFSALCAFMCVWVVVRSFSEGIRIEGDTVVVVNLFRTIRILIGEMKTSSSLLGETADCLAFRTCP